LFIAVGGGSREKTAVTAAVGVSTVVIAAACIVAVRNNRLADEYRKTVRLRMIRQESLASIGQLTAGVAHEISNPLGYVISNFNVIKKYIQRYENVLDGIEGLADKDGNPDDEDIAWIRTLWDENRMYKTRKDMPEIFEDTKHGIDSMKIILNNLTNFSRVSTNREKKPYDLNKGIRETLLFAGSELKNCCEVKFEEAEIPEIQANSTEINQVILNILINSIHAIKERYPEGKGLITIRTFKEADYAGFSLGDNGAGMTEEVGERIFEPFFSTKPVGQGTGLGLSIVHEIVVNNHKGKIHVDPGPGTGAVFQVLLPLNPYTVEEDWNEDDPACG
ncbi:MAG: hypothetical protein HGA22_13530, partial [Clostridiales bacterium]|nr:hypothetical protein [Clostridiales bacterium]